MPESGRSIGFLNGYRNLIAALCLIAAPFAYSQQNADAAIKAKQIQTKVQVQTVDPAVTPVAPVAAPMTDADAAKQVAAPATQSPSSTAPDTSSATPSVVSAAAASTLLKYKGVPIDKLEYAGVDIAADDPLLQKLQVEQGKPLNPDGVRQAVRRLFETGLYRSIDVRGVVNGEGDGRTITVIFFGTPRYFVGRVTVEGPKSERMISLLQYATALDPGSPFLKSHEKAAIEGIRKTLAQNGYNAATITASEQRDSENALINLTFHVVQGVQSRIGNLTVEGDPGLSVEDFRKKGKLKEGKKVTRDTTSNALTRLRKYYQKNDRLEAAVSMKDQEYAADRKRVDYKFNSDEGPVVKVLIQGTKVSKARQKKLLPIYEESAVDNDLLNEGAHNIREFLQRQGYFDAQVDPHVEGIGTPTQTVIFQVTEGKKYKVMAVDIQGNKYFDTETLRERMQVVKTDAYVRNGRYSQALLASDVDSITSLYKANGFTHVGIETTTQSADKGKSAELRIGMKITEGDQQKFGDVTMTGVDPEREQDVRGMMNTIPSQPFSLSTVSGDRDAILQYYLSRGFTRAKVEVKQQVHPTDQTRTDIQFLITEGEQVFVSKVLVSGAHRTRANLVNRQLLLKPGDPMDESALVDMQRKYYDLAIFNQANVAIRNPDGNTDRKMVMVQLTEAKRYDVTYGVGFEVQTGRPQTNCRAQESAGYSNCSPQGTSKPSFRVSADITRINLRGTDQSITLHTTYGLLERIAMLSYNVPRLWNKENFAGVISGGYSNVQNVSTFKASTLQGTFRVTQKIPRTDTLVYDFTYRRVVVDQNSIQVTANLIPLLAQPVRVGGPTISWLHDSRAPSPLDAQRGHFFSVQEFLANGVFGSQTDFNRLDLSHSSYYTWGTRRKYTFARNTRLGFELASGSNPNMGTTSCLGDLLTTNPSCNPIPLPERLYVGGASSHRGFGINSAGPRDLGTGYPVGGSAAFVNSFELRMPPPVLPLVGQSVSFVLFEDMGNAFLNVSDLWPSFLRFRQPHEETCHDASGGSSGSAPGKCDFAYFSHAVGLGARYGTPVGPIRLDFSYNLNPTVYPIVDDYSGSVPNHAVGRTSRFNFFFSIGQSF